jgi:protein O-mannosyl-transferase
MPRVKTEYLYVALFVLTFAAYLPTWNNDFVDFDDEAFITQNRRVVEGLSWSGLGWALTTYHGNYWQPVSWLSLQLDAHLFTERNPGGDPVLSPAAFHGQSLLWHAATALLLFGLWHRLTGARWRSFLVAALFAVHPMHVESVAWAAERKDVLCAFFGVVTLWAYARYAEAPGGQRYLGVMAAYALSLMSKPMLMTLPFVLLLVDYWPLRRVGGGWRAAGDEDESSARRPWRTLVLEKVPLLLMAAAVAAVTVLMREEQGAPVSFRDLPLSDRVANAFAAYGWYVAHSFVPVGLAPLYPHPLSNWSVPRVLAGAATLLALTLLSLWQARRRPWLVVGWLWFVGTLVPVLGLAQGGMQAWADRFCYWPHIGLSVAAVWGLAELANRCRIPAPVSATAAALALGCFAVMTWGQVGFWHDRATLWERALAVTEENHRAHIQLGRYCLEQGRLDEAEAHCAECVRISPATAKYHYSLGAALLKLGKEDEAAPCFLEALRRTPTMTDAWYNLGLARLHQGDAEKAVRCFRKALELDPGSDDTLAMLGYGLWRQGRRQEAVETFDAALRRNPAQGVAWRGLGLARLAEGRVGEAIEALEKAVSCNPQQVNAYSDLGVALGRAGRWAEAVSFHLAAFQAQAKGEQKLREMHGRPGLVDGLPRLVVFECRLAFALNHCGDRRSAAAAYRDARERHPHWPEEFAAKAWRLATDPDANLRDPQQAYELAGQAVEGEANPPAPLLDALAAALAARGDFEEAARTAQRALDRAAAAGDLALANAIRDRLQLYQHGKPALPSS